MIFQKLGPLASSELQRQSCCNVHNTGRCPGSPSCLKQIETLAEPHKKTRRIGWREEHVETLHLTARVHSNGRFAIDIDKELHLMTDMQIGIILASLNDLGKPEMA